MNIHRRCVSSSHLWLRWRNPKESRWDERKGEARAARVCSLKISPPDCQRKTYIGRSAAAYNFYFRSRPTSWIFFLGWNSEKRRRLLREDKNLPYGNAVKSLERRACRTPEKKTLRLKNKNIKRSWFEVKHSCEGSELFVLPPRLMFGIFWEGRSHRIWKSDYEKITTRLSLEQKKVFLKYILVNDNESISRAKESRYKLNTCHIRRMFMCSHDLF